MTTERGSFRPPGTIPGAHRRNVIVLLGYLLLFALLTGLLYALVTGRM